MSARSSFVFAAVILLANVSGCNNENAFVAADLIGEFNTEGVGAFSGGNGSYCDPVENWDPAWEAFEQQVLALVNQRRAAGAGCGTYGDFSPAGPVTMNSALRCAARRQSMDLVERNFFGHTNPDGDGPGQRVAAAGYRASNWGENIGRGFTSPEDVVEWWMNSDGHCANMMNPAFTEIGVGYYGDYSWTIVLGRPR